MKDFLALHSSVAVPILIAVLGGIALAIDVAFVRPARRIRENKAALAAESAPPSSQVDVDAILLKIAESARR